MTDWLLQAFAPTCIQADNHISLYAYIIHSPKLNPKFDEDLQKSFQRLNLITGEDFLFTSFVDPPKAWLNWLHSNEKLNKVNQVFFSKEQIKNPKLIIKTLDSSLTALIISEELGVNVDNLPFLVVTPHPKENYFYLLNLSNENLLSDMAGLTELSVIIKMGGEMEEAIKSTGLSLKKIQLEIPLANIFHKLSFRLIKVSRNRRVLNELGVKLSSLNSVFSKPSKVSDTQKSENDLIFEGYQIVSNRLSSVIYKNIKDRRGKSKDFDLHILSNCFGLNIEELLEFKKYIEPSTFTFLLQGAKLKLVYSVFFGDTGPFILPFGKAFEIEMSYSLVHWVRNQYEIQLPEFFYKYQPNMEIILGEPPGFNFNFLDPKTQEWRPPMIGGQLIGVSLVNKGRKAQPFDTFEDFQSFLTLGFRIKNIRNNSCHPSETTYSDLEEIIQIWKTLYQKGLLKKLFGLKNTFRVK
ncbi:hypothetical protein [Mongoliitalea lutea]|uniref:Uncharacterized protein n=1 Tax=Mongoliitalea lutea TaxID=849756 RepID=A0A8J3G6U3_9BACT|nr:hypothetical protein [Mongoliitalea lutea]GHB49134.1 hypothetical protein GCM10008106_32410 [Mongoliitalea lutea]